ncbi:hydrolase [Brachyspira hampsonii 30446]|uniref:Hydrolase n=1 Tax=Brachyspira hampsonii 30446 TaxID=1289135 RepID=A0A2U4EY35_9SPIR|nr:HAD family phosphatase [Brachyspira hampsonii]EKV56252.1 hydrolase [Brachyspira hampsonii 30446]MBW5394891.1 HAD family phosphatase [Brachyspira hampsonii]OEJ17155.1 hydrolase [Brachyspira hampsonii]
MLNNDNIKLLIFDMDGTLIDSAYLNYYSYYNAFKEFNIELDKDYYYNKCFGLHYKIFTKNILELNNKITKDENKNNELIESIHNLKEKIYLANLNLIQIHPFILETLIDNYNKKENKKHTALATTASPNGVYGILKEFKLEKLFDLILTGNDVEKKKPHPEIFYKCMEHFNVKEKESIIFEDSEVGLEAANQTNAWVIKVEKWAKI